MYLHKEGRKIILTSSILLLLLTLLAYRLVDFYPILVAIIWLGFLVFFLLILWFFRVPVRENQPKDGIVYAPADGKVVVIEKTTENEYLNDERVQVSIFMSPLNVHINYYPFSGTVRYQKYHPGKYLVAWHPKSSKENERTTVALKDRKGEEIVIRQIAGAVARRIVCYAKKNDKAVQGEEFGFIKFGSRVDLFLPPDSEILVNLGDKTKGKITPIARLRKD
jgi:phosphatidylserine decarboxylase